MVRILLVEDERSLREGLTDLLHGAGHEVVAVDNGPAALETGTAAGFDVVVLDLMLPGMDGIEVCRGLRDSRPGLPILMLTARGSEEDKVVGLEAGADDYVTKPFGARELLARIDAVTRRVQGLPTEPEVLEADGCRIDLGRHTAERAGHTVGLTPREVGIVRWLYRHRHRAVPRSELLERVWNSAPDLQTRTVDMTVVKLRQKLENDPANPRIVVTVTGVGYAWAQEEHGSRNPGK